MINIDALRRTTAVIIPALFCLFTAAPSLAADPLFRAQGEMTGEVSSSSAIVQTRLTSVEGNVEGDVAGADGFVRFEYADNADFNASQFTAWSSARAEADYIVKKVLRNLKPGARYFYRVHYGAEQENAKRGATCSFRTLQGVAGIEPTSFAVVTGMNYSGFHGAKRKQKGPRPDRAAGYPALETMIGMKLDFFVGTGDNVYYDGRVFKATELKDLRRKWHEQFVQSRFVELFRNVPTYWEKDDHDHRYNDCDRIGERQPSSELGIATFREQMPVVDLADPNAKTYRTFRVNRDLQIWLVEGRDYRSPNRMADGPDKTLWGAEQISWLKSTLLKSDATFKLLISPTPLVGPDDAYKIDNHTNHKGFRNEGRAFFEWVVQHELHRKGFYTICGDRHWQYHSKDPMGIEEFSCGAIVDENSRLGRRPGDPKSTDPDAEVHQFYTQAKRSGGFLRVTVRPGPKAGTGSAQFSFVDEHGDLLYEIVKIRPRAQ